MPTQDEIDNMVASYTTEGEAELIAELLEMEDEDMGTDC